MSRWADLFDRLSKSDNGDNGDSGGTLAGLDGATVTNVSNVTLEERENAAVPALRLRDGRALYRFDAGGPIAADVDEMMREARSQGAALVADGSVLVVAARPGMRPSMLDELRGNSAAVIAALRGEHRHRARLAASARDLPGAA